MESEEEQKLLEQSKKFAEETGIALNPNEKIAKAVVKGLIAKEKQFGEKYCPCRVLSKDKEKDKEIICPCVFHRKEIEEQGHCHCNLFVAKE